MFSSEDNAITPTSLQQQQQQQFLVKSNSAPSRIDNDTISFSRPILRSISNVVTNDKKEIKSSQYPTRKAKQISKISGSNQPSRQYRPPNIILHPLDNVVMPIEAENLSPQTPLVRHLNRKRNSIEKSPLSNSYSSHTFLSDENQLSSPVFESQILQTDFNLSLLINITKSTPIKSLDLSSSFGTAYNIADIPVLPSTIPSSSIINELFLFLGTNPSITNHLTYLNLSGVGFSLENIALLKNLKSLEVLNLSNTGISSTHLQVLTENFPILCQTLKELNISENMLLSDDIFSYLVKFSSLTKLNLDYTSISYDGLRYYLLKLPTYYNLKTLIIHPSLYNTLLALKQSIMAVIDFHSSLVPADILLLDIKSIDSINDPEYLIHQLYLHSIIHPSVIYARDMHIDDLRSILKQSQLELIRELYILKIMDLPNN